MWLWTKMVKLNNILNNDNVVSEADILKLREEIDYFSDELAKIFKAEEMLERSKRD